MKEPEPQKIEDSRGEAIKSIVDRIGYGITWETADIMITNLLRNWNSKN